VKKSWATSLAVDVNPQTSKSSITLIQAEADYDTSIKQYAKQHVDYYDAPMSCYKGVGRKIFRGAKEKGRKIAKKTEK